MSGFIAPMLASPLPENFNPKPNEWAAEEKFDGHRLIVRVTDGKVLAWSRNELPRVLPNHVYDTLAKFPNGCYDGELLVPGKRSYGVTELTNSKDLVYVMFDILESWHPVFNVWVSLCGDSYVARRAVLITVFDSLFGCLQPNPQPVRLSESHPILSAPGMRLLCEQVWARDGEGLILKKLTSRYTPGKRPKDWFKIKQLRSAVLTIIGFQAGKMGPHSVMILRDDEGHGTTVKWKSLQILAEVERAPASFIGRRVRIEFQERTPDGSYRHPRFDHWENNGD